MLTDSSDSLVATLYPQLKRLARDMHWRYSAGETLRSTALVNESFLKLRSAGGFADEKHFLRTAARAEINGARSSRGNERTRNGFID